jgi:hypothetical protein
MGSALSLAPLWGYWHRRSERQLLSRGMVARDSSRFPSGDLRSAFTLRSNRLRYARLATFTPLRMTLSWVSLKHSPNGEFKERDLRLEDTASRSCFCSATRGLQLHGYGSG